MRRGRAVVRAVATTVVLVVGAARADAQGPKAEVDAAPAELTLGVTINARGSDINAAPACFDLSFPCTHAKASDWAGFGLEGAVDVAISAHVAVTADVGASAHAWDGPSEAITHRVSRNVVRAFLVGPTIRTRFFRPSMDPWENDRFFLQALAGAEDSTIFGSRPVVQVNVGVDGHPSPRRDGWHATVRMELGYRISPGAPYAATSWRAFFGTVIGPRER